MSKALVILSGGQDSTTCLFWACETFSEVIAVTFNYGQRHAIEIESARKIAELAGVPHEVIDVGPILRGTSPLVSSENLEQYADMNSLPGGLEKTFVPGRNMLFLVLAANLAYCQDAQHLITGVCQEDFGGYPDCRQTFITATEQALNLALFLDPHGEDASKALKIHTPLMDLTKAESIRLAMNLSGCYDALAFSHTSYDGQYPPTGKDHATLLRAKGFYEAGVPDPLVVRAWREGLMELPSTSNYSGVA